jgi:hypothetical protein
MKTIILWRRKRARTFKMWGLATATCSAVTIREGWRMAAAREGVMAVVDAPTAAHARRAIAAHYSGAKLDIGAPGVVGVHLDGRVITIGANAALAIAGASEAIRNWDARLRRDSRVAVTDTRALGKRTDDAAFNIHDAFGRSF